MPGKKILAYIIPILLLAIDQTIKFLVLTKIPQEGVFLIEQNNFVFSLQLIKNQNLAFSISMPQYIIFAIVALIIIILIYLLYRAIKKDNSIQIIAYFIIIVGAISNLFDRIIHDGVIDFISLNIFDYQLAVFNLADVWIVIGVAILLLKEPFKGKI